MGLLMLWCLRDLAVDWVGLGWRGLLLWVALFYEWCVSCVQWYIVEKIVLVERES